MISIAICDDNTADLRRVSRAVKRYCILHPEHETAPRSYPSPYDLLTATESGQFHHIYVINAAMADLSGIELGRVIRSRNSACSIIYCAPTPDYALEAFSVQAQNYLLKPVAEKELFQALDQACQHLAKDQAGGISIRSREGQLFLPFYQITYVELVDRRMVFHLKGGLTRTSLVLRGSFEAALAPLLADPRFLQPHKSFVANMDYIRVQSDNQITLEDGTGIPISCRKQQKALVRYHAYLSSGRTDRFSPD